MEEEISESLRHLTYNLQKITDQKLEMPVGESISSDLFDVLKSVDLQISNPGSFCSASTENASSLSELMKSLFKTSADSSTKTFGPFQELLVDGFDGETIWEELQTRNRPLTRFVKKRIVAISKSVNVSKKLKAKALNAATKKSEEFAIEKDEIVTDDEEDLDSDDANEDVSEELDEEENEADEDDEDASDRDEDAEDGGSDIDLNMDSDDVEDEEEYDGGGDASYDNIDDMQAWLDKQEDLEEKHEKKLARLEKLAAQKGAVEEGPDSDDEEDDMLFVEREMYDDHESEEDDDEDNSSIKDRKKKKSNKNMKGSEIKYEDFFRDDVSKTKSESSAKSSSGKKSKSAVKNQADMDHGSDDDHDMEEEEEDNEGDEDDSDGDFDENGEDDYDFGDDDDDIEDGKSSKVITRTRALTTHEKRELKMAAQIKEIEGKNIVSSSLTSTFPSLLISIAHTAQLVIFLHHSLLFLANPPPNFSFICT